MTTLISSYDYQLPTDSIAANPLDHRSDSKLLHYNLKKSSYTDQKFSKLLEYFKERRSVDYEQYKSNPSKNKFK